MEIHHHHLKPEIWHNNNQPHKYTIHFMSGFVFQVFYSFFFVSVSFGKNFTNTCSLFEKIFLFSTFYSLSVWVCKFDVNHSLIWMIVNGCFVVVFCCFEWEKKKLLKKHMKNKWTAKTSFGQYKTDIVF